eukprot:2589536-Karenia_brevis.AAC.1
MSEEARKRKSEASSTTEEQSAAKRSMLKAGKPFDELFDAIECGGKGDCAFCCVGRGLHHLNGKVDKSGGADFAPGGRVQASLRLMTAQELRANEGKYGNAATKADEIVKKGTPACNASMAALAQAVKADLMIWRRSDGPAKTWTLSGPAKRHKKAVWPMLKNQHYKWLKPKAKM